MKTTEKRFAKNKAELARILDVARGTVDAWLKLPDHPKSAANGKFIIAEWRAFAANRAIDSAGEESATIKLERSRLGLEQDRVKLMAEAGAVMPVEWVDLVLAHMAISVRNVVLNSPLSAEQREGLISELEKIDCAAFLAELGKQ